MSNNRGSKQSDNDDRMVCRYGTRCYQKNPDHHRKFKHPNTPNKKKNGNKNEQKQDNNKKRKNSDDEISNDASKAKKMNTEQTNDEDAPETEVTLSNSDEKAEEKDVEEKQEDENEESKEKTEGTENNEEKSVTNNDTAQNKDESKANTVESNEEHKDSETKEEKETANVNKEKTESEEKPPERIKLQSKTRVVVKPKVVENKAADEKFYSECQELIKQIFLFPMPSDFFKFYDFCKEVNPKDPGKALKNVDLTLVGPYDVLLGNITKDTPNLDSLLTHWRYYYDPPEFQTVIKGNEKEGLHIGYWRDRPSGDPEFLAINSSEVNCKIKPVGENIFAAVFGILEEKSKKASPFEKINYLNLLGKLRNFSKNSNITLESQTPKMKSREKKVVSRTIHGAGIVCPFNKKTQLGYRELSVSDNDLIKIVKKIDEAENEDDKNAARSELQEVVRLATIAGDECDFGTCLELGHDLLSTGCADVQNAALSVLSIAYNQLDRQPFLTIVEAHMKNRKKGTDNSALSAVES